MHYDKQNTSDGVFKIMCPAPQLFEYRAAAGTICICDNQQLNWSME